MSLQELETIIKQNFPQAGVPIAFGYGSKVIRQKGVQSVNDLVDLIFVVDNPIQWHRENYEKNKQHYSFLRHLPNNIELITNIQERYGAKTYFNPFVEVSDISIKYGVIKTDHLIDDLSLWDNLYIAGRLHKPVEFLWNNCDRNEPLRSALRFNKESAARAALLMLPETFNSIQLYTTITGLSYNGDLRMIFGEDKNKIDNIVAGQREKFDQLYLPLIRMNPSFRDQINWSEGKQIFTQDLSPGVVLRNLKLLPREVRRNICQLHGRVARTREADVVLASLSRGMNYNELVARALASIVRRSSLSQSLKGVLTAGFVKSLKYSNRKVAKSIKSRFNWL